MPLFFFHLVDSQRVFRDDEEGVPLQDLAAARAYAHDDILELVGQRIPAAHNWTEWRMDVADSEGNVLLTIPFLEAVLDSGSRSK